MLYAFVFAEYLLTSVFGHSLLHFLMMVCTRHYARKPTATFKLWTVPLNSQSLYSLFCYYTGYDHWRVYALLYLLYFTSACKVLLLKKVLSTMLTVTFYMLLCFHVLTENF